MELRHNKNLIQPPPLTAFQNSVSNSVLMTVSETSDPTGIRRLLAFILILIVYSNFRQNQHQMPMMGKSFVIQAMDYLLSTIN
jgi:hypothetical protein